MTTEEQRFKRGLENPKKDKWAKRKYKPKWILGKLFKSGDAYEVQEIIMRKQRELGVKGKIMINPKVEIKPKEEPKPNLFVRFWGKIKLLFINSFKRFKRKKGGLAIFIL